MCIASKQYKYSSLSSHKSLFCWLLREKLREKRRNKMKLLAVLLLIGLTEICFFEPAMASGSWFKIWSMEWTVNNNFERFDSLTPIWLDLIYFLFVWNGRTIILLEKPWDFCSLSRWQSCQWHTPMLFHRFDSYRLVEIGLIICNQCEVLYLNLIHHQTYPRIYLFIDFFFISNIFSIKTCKSIIGFHQMIKVRFFSFSKRTNSKFIGHFCDIKFDFFNVKLLAFH